MRIGEYELLDRIAEGGMAEVWRAKARGAAGFEKVVVVKRVLPTLAARPGFAELLIREAKIAARLSHPNIVQIFDLGEVDGTYFIAMEYVHGTDLAHALTHRMSGEHLSLALRVWIAAEAARALDHAHRRKGEDGRPMHIVHRDVSPQNVLLAHEGVVKVADFGIARADEAGLGRGEDPRVLRGKYAYMSPEQARGEALDRRSDIFALGVVLFEAITGQRLFRGKSSQETLALVRAAALPDLAMSGVPAELVPVLGRALAASRDERHAWAGELHSELMAYLYRRGEPVGEQELALAMERMFPAEEQLTPNKLRVDVMLRAYDDATGVSAPGQFPDATPLADVRTQSLPIARRSRVEVRRVAILVASHRGPNASLWAEAIEANGGTLLPSTDGAARAVFGQLAGVERAPVHAVRAALDFRHRLRALGIAPEGAAVVVGECRTSDGALLEPDESLMAAAAALLAGAPTEVRVEEALAPELERLFVLDREAGDADGRAVFGRAVVGYRRRQDRELSGQRATGPLVGRRAELAALRGALARAREEAVDAVHVTGVPGVGKTRLLAELRAQIDGPTWVVGRADESHAVQDYGILADLVRDLCGIEPDDTPAERHERVDRLKVLGLAPHEVHTLGELVGLAYPVANLERSGRPRGVEVVVALRKALLALARDAGVVVVLEDLHFADDASLQLLPLLVRGLRHRGVLCVTSRRAGATVPVPPGATLVVPPLDVEQTGKALAGALRARATVTETAKWAHAETGGVPEWIEVLARLAPHDALLNDDGHVSHAPFEPTIDVPARHRVAAWLDPLRRIERTILLLAAVSPGETPTRLLLGALEDEPVAVERALTRLLARGWITEPGSGAHPVDRTTGAWGGVSAELPQTIVACSRMVARSIGALVEPGERARAHQRLLAVLEGRPAGTRVEAELLAFHAARAVDRQRAVEYHERASELAAAAGELSSAARLALHGAELARDSGDDPSGERFFELAVRAAELGLRGNDVRVADEAVCALGAVFDARARLEQRVTVAMLGAEVALFDGLAEAAWRAMAGVANELDDLDGPAARSRARTLLATCALRAGRRLDFEEVLRKATGEAVMAADVVLEGRALAALAAGFARADQVTQADAAVAQALALAARVGQPEVRARSLAAMGAVLEALGDPGTAADRLDEAAALAAESSLGVLLAELLMRSMILKLRAGRDVSAAKTAEALQEISRQRKSAVLQRLALCARSVVGCRTYPDPGALAAFERAAAGIPEEALLERAFAMEMRAAELAALGDPEGAALARDDAATIAETAGWASYARLLREPS
jgi:tRNA A-37 threonylcarbamoyl transferase component Bud32